MKTIFLSMLAIFMLSIIACKKEKNIDNNITYQVDSVQIITKDGYSNTILNTKTIVVSHKYWDSLICSGNSGYIKNANELNYQFSYDSTIFRANINYSTFYNYYFQTGINSFKLDFNYRQNKLDSINYSSSNYTSKGKTEYLNGNINSITFFQNYSSSNDTIKNILNFENPSLFLNQKSKIGIDLNDVLLNTYINSNLFASSILIPNYRNYEIGLLLNSYFSYNINNDNLIEKIQSSLYSTIVTASYFSESNNNNRINKMIVTQKTGTTTDLITDYIFYYHN